MAAPLFIHVMTNGDIWITNALADTPTGTVAGTFRCQPDAVLSKITTVSGTGPYAVSGATGKLGTGKDLGTR